MIVAFRKFANAPNKKKSCSLSQDFVCVATHTNAHAHCGEVLGNTTQKLLLYTK